MAFDTQNFLSGLGGLFGGMFGHSDDPYNKGAGTYKEWGDKGAATQNPYYQGGTQALGNYQNWLNKQQNPTKFINDTMKDYSQSPHAKYMQQQAINAAQNTGSADGTMGSTALMQQMQQNAANISSQDQNQWLQNVLGINKQYGQGQQNLTNMGQNSANTLTGLYNNMGSNLGGAAYGASAGKNQDFWNMLGGGLGVLGNFF